MATKRYPAELKERAVRMVFECERDYSLWYAAVKSVASKLDIGAESLRVWVKKADTSAGGGADNSVDAARVKGVERKVKELRRRMTF